MPILLVLVGVVVAAFAAMHFGFVPPLDTQILLRIRNGNVDVVKGVVKTHARENTVELLSTAGVTHSFIAITSGNRVAFGRRIPPSIHQRLRNVLLNQ